MSTPPETPPTAEHPDVSIKAGVATITLNDPSTRNALSLTAARRLRQICDEIDRDPTIGVVVLRGAGGTFCSGAARSDLNSTPHPFGTEGFEAAEELYEAFQRFGALQPATIAAVRGAAVGAGLNLMLAADLRIVAEDARLLAGFDRVGLHPGGGFFCLCGRSAGREAATALGIFGESIDGRRAVVLGVAFEALADDEVEPRALALAERAARDPALVRRCVRSARTELGPPALSWSAACDVERGPQAWSQVRRLSGTP